LRNEIKILQIEIKTVIFLKKRVIIFQNVVYMTRMALHRKEKSGWQEITMKKQKGRGNQISMKSKGNDKEREFKKAVKKC